MNNVMKAVVALGLVSSGALAQVQNNRRVLPEDITVTPTPLPGEYLITVQSRVANQRTTLTNLSSSLILTINGVAVNAFPQYVVIGGGQTCNGSCPTGDCSANGPGSTCSDFAPYGGQGCACDIVVTPNNNNFTARLSPGDVLGLTIEPLPGAALERFRDDDTVAVPFGQAPCDPDFNKDGNVDQDDVLALINVIGGGGNVAGSDPDFNRDGNADQDDVLALINVVAGAPCP